MAVESTVRPASGRSAIPIRKINNSDLNAALSEGYSDFLAKRGDLLFIGALYPAIGFGAAMLALGGNLLALLFPAVAGLTLLGPLVSAGFYELAKRREDGQDSSWWHFFDIRKSEAFDDFLAMGTFMVLVFGAWMVSALLIYRAFFGIEAPTSILGFLSDLFTTPQGWGLIIVGNLVGLLFALLVLATTLVSLPMLIDKNVSAGTAVKTSIRAFNANRGPVLRWGLMVALLLFLGSVPLFLGLAVVLPVLGYATWHLYGRLVDRSALASSERRE